jgi:hypothetical protein
MNIIMQLGQMEIFGAKETVGRWQHCRARPTLYERAASVQIEFWFKISTNPFLKTFEMNFNAPTGVRINIRLQKIRLK